MKIRVFYVGRGCSVLIELGAGRFGIVDCYRGDRGGHPLLQHLLGLSVPCERIEFLVLTHPHEDHFVGVASLLKAFGTRIERLYDCGVDFRQLIVAVYGSRAKGDLRPARNSKPLPASAAAELPVVV